MKRANANLDKADLPPLPAGLTPHNLPRTFASGLYALGESPPVVMAEMGHTSAALALKAYTKSIARGDGDQAQLAALVAGADWANTGEQPLVAASEVVAGGAAA